MALIENLTAIGNAIREKNGTTDLIPLADMPQAILDISSSGGGVQYTNIVYNEDNTITLTDKDGVEHTMSCTYEGDKLIGVIYDGKIVDLTYDGDSLVKVGGTVIDLSGLFLSYGDSLYKHYGFDKTTYPYLFMVMESEGGTATIYFVERFNVSTKLNLYNVIRILDGVPTSVPLDDVESIVNYLLDKTNTPIQTVIEELSVPYYDSKYHYANFDTTSWGASYQL